MKVVQFEQGTPEWHAWRIEGLGSSDVSAIAAHANLVENKPWMKSISRVYEEKKGLRPKETFDAWRMRRGHAGEGFARAVLAERLGQVFVPICVESDTQPMLRASLDGINFARNHFVEIKTPNDVVHALAASGIIVDYYLVQMLHQAIVLFGHPEDWKDDGAMMSFASGRPEDRTVHVVTVSVFSQQSMAIALYGALIDFIDCMANNRAPMGEAFSGMASRFASLQREIERLVAAQTEIKDSMVEFLLANQREKGNASGVTLSWQPVSKVLNVKAALQGLGITDAQIEPYMKERKAYWRASVASVSGGRRRPRSDEETDSTGEAASAGAP